MKKILAILLASLILFSMCGCSSIVAVLKSSLSGEGSEAVSEPEKQPGKKPADKEKEPEESREESTESPEETSEAPSEAPTEAPETIPAEPVKPDYDPSLISVRQALLEAEPFAVAYFGFVEEFPGTLGTVVGNLTPQLGDDLPFFYQIPEEQVIGTHGEVYCIVPCGEDDTVSVNRLMQDVNGDLVTGDVLYRSESGDPIVLVCNYGGFSPDCEVVITDSNGATTVFYPMLDENGYVSCPLDEEGYPACLDLTSYNEIYGTYHTWIRYGWLPPLKAGLDNTSWNFSTTREDGTDVDLMLDLFGDGTASFLWLLDGEPREFTGSWYIEENGDTSMLTLDLSDGREVFYEQYPVMIDPSGTRLIWFTGLEGTYLPIDYDAEIAAVFDYAVG